MGAGFKRSFAEGRRRDLVAKPDLEGGLARPSV